ncbi:MAG: hypothetical protein KatS3mg112_0322 [Thermogutta sp.]|nr:MAG: hypothetical protein KatS3mg112_0322 [Thermogutta sp.]
MLLIEGPFIAGPMPDQSGTRFMRDACKRRPIHRRGSVGAKDYLPRLSLIVRRMLWLAPLMLAGGLWAGLASVVVAEKADQASVGSLPNILIILADDLGYGDVGCYNPESKVPTPCLDQLAAQGMRFTDAHSAATVCTPSRYSLLTGRMRFRTGMAGVFTGAGGPCLIKKGRLTLPQMLRDKGYATACVGKWHVGLTFLDKDGQPINQNGLEAVKRIDYSRPIPDAPVHRGFDYFFGTACCPGTDWLYAYIEGDRIPVPPAGPLDRSTLPHHPYSEDNRPGLIAPGYNLEEIDLVFLRKSQEWLEHHVRKHPNQPFFCITLPVRCIFPHSLLSNSKGLPRPVLTGTSFSSYCSVTGHFWDRRTSVCSGHLPRSFASRRRAAER